MKGNEDKLNYQGMVMEYLVGDGDMFGNDKALAVGLGIKKSQIPKVIKAWQEGKYIDETVSELKKKNAMSKMAYEQPNFESLYDRTNTGKAVTVKDLYQLYQKENNKKYTKLYTYDRFRILYREWGEKAIDTNYMAKHNDLKNNRKSRVQYEQPDFGELCLEVSEYERGKVKILYEKYLKLCEENGKKAYQYDNFRKRYLKWVGAKSETKEYKFHKKNLFEYLTVNTRIPYELVCKKSEEISIIPHVDGFFADEIKQFMNNEKMFIMRFDLESDLENFLNLNVYKIEQKLRGMINKFILGIARNEDKEKIEANVENIGKVLESISSFFKIDQKYYIMICVVQYCLKEKSFVEEIKKSESIPKFLSLFGFSGEELEKENLTELEEVFSNLIKESYGFKILGAWSQKKLLEYMIEDIQRCIPTKVLKKERPIKKIVNKNDEEEKIDYRWNKFISEIIVQGGMVPPKCLADQSLSSYNIKKTINCTKIERYVKVRENNRSDGEIEEQMAMEINEQEIKDIPMSAWELFSREDEVVKNNIRKNYEAIIADMPGSIEEVREFIQDDLEKFIEKLKIYKRIERKQGEVDSENVEKDYQQLCGALKNKINSDGNEKTVLKKVLNSTWLEISKWIKENHYSWTEVRLRLDRMIEEKIFYANSDEYIESYVIENIKDLIFAELLYVKKRNLTIHICPECGMFYFNEEKHASKCVPNATVKEIKAWYEERKVSLYKQKIRSKFESREIDDMYEYAINLYRKIYQYAIVTYRYRTVDEFRDKIKKSSRKENRIARDFNGIPDLYQASLINESEILNAWSCLKLDEEVSREGEKEIEDMVNSPGMF